jgi:hypothetical protein
LTHYYPRKVLISLLLIPCVWEFSCIVICNNVGQYVAHFCLATISLSSAE